MGGTEDCLEEPVVGREDVLLSLFDKEEESDGILCKTP